MWWPFTKDPTHEWPQVRPELLRLDLRQRSIQGIRLRDSAEALRKLGRPDNRRPFKDTYFTYGYLGCRIWIDPDQRITDVGMAIVDAAREGLTGNDVELVLPDGRAMRITRLTTHQDLTGALHVTPDLDTDEDEVVATYRIGIGFFAECELNGRIKWLNMHEA